MGRFGVVMQTTFRGEQVVAKYIKPALFSEENLKQFMSVAIDFDDDNIVRLKGASPSGVIVREWLPTSLKEKLKKGPLSKPIMKSVSLDVARGLLYLHTQKPNPFHHGGLTSANVLIDPGNGHKAKISDFCCYFLHKQVGLVPTCRAYIAPEAHNISTQTPKMDIFSFGILLVEMKTSQLPIDQDHNQIMGSVMQIPLSNFGKLVEKCICVRPDGRPDTHQLISELERL